jgi:hypothetical protein
MQDRKCVSTSPTATPSIPNTISAPLLRPASIPIIDSTSLKPGKDPMFNKTLTPRSHCTSTQYDFDLDSGAILHVTAYTLEAAVERVEYFLHRLEERAAKGPIDKFLRAHDAADVPLAFFLRNRAIEDVSCWLTRFE